MQCVLHILVSMHSSKLCFSEIYSTEHPRQVLVMLIQSLLVFMFRNMHRYYGTENEYREMPPEQQRMLKDFKR